ncbi:MAG TPA: hypothetical protein VMB81_31655 [Candidatus Sulfotelmatobacter sp.]|nr:hypothetical protein [Candidatus Sulfotelmatobacter sp.]
MKSGLLSVLIVAGAVAGCGYFKKDPNQGELASACQIVKCECLKVRTSIVPQFTKVEPQDVLWRENGTAYCPEGYDLKRKEAPSIYDRPLE